MAVESLVITTSLASNPIDGAENNCNILIEDDPEKMAVIINDIFDNSINYKGIKTAAKKLVINNYSLKVIESKLYNIVDKYIS
jgi:glycosyltransferase involved in cell wall biosynthesis